MRFQQCSLISLMSSCTAEAAGSSKSFGIFSSIKLPLCQLAKVTKESPKNNLCKPPTPGEIILRERPWICRMPVALTSLLQVLHQMMVVIFFLDNLAQLKANSFCQCPSVLILCKKYKKNKVYSLGLWHGWNIAVAVSLRIFFFCLDLSRFSTSRADCSHVGIDYSIRPEKALSCEKTN